MTPETQTLLTVGVPTLTVLLGILVNNARLSDLSARIGDGHASMNARIDDLRSHFDMRLDQMQETWRAELRRVEEVIDARLTNLEERMR